MPLILVLLFSSFAFPSWSCKPEDLFVLVAEPTQVPGVLQGVSGTFKEKEVDLFLRTMIGMGVEPIDDGIRRIIILRDVSFIEDSDSGSTEVTFRHEGLGEASLIMNREHYATNLFYLVGNQPGVKIEFKGKRRQLKIKELNAIYVLSPNGSVLPSDFILRVVK